MQNHEVTPVLLPDPVNSNPVHSTGASVFLQPHPGPRQVTQVMDLSDQRGLDGRAAGGLPNLGRTGLDRCKYRSHRVEEVHSTDAKVVADAQGATDAAIQQAIADRDRVLR